MITLLIPTMNRPDFVIRLINYYRELRFEGGIYIADSSVAEDIVTVKSAAKALKDNIDTLYCECPGLNNAEAVNHLLDSVTTPYAVLLPDDDFLVPRALEECINFLENDADYSAAHGLGVMFSLKSTGAYGHLLWTDRYWQRPIEDESGVRRLVNHLENYFVTLFSVHRTGHMKAMYRNTSALADKTFATELLPCCRSVIYGKVKELDCIYLARQVHDRRTVLPDLYDWVTSSDWLSSYEIFRDCLVNALVRQDGISVEEAREVVKKAFWSYLAKGLTHKWQVRYGKKGNRPGYYWREVARRVPGLLSVAHKLRSATSGSGSEMSLPVLLHPSSSYHADFMPIYRVVSEAP
jgi:glycosyltransferase domain-containing protein